MIHPKEKLGSLKLIFGSQVEAIHSSEALSSMSLSLVNAEQPFSVVPWIYLLPGFSEAWGSTAAMEQPAEA